MIKIDPEKRITLYNRDFDEMRGMLDGTIQQIIPMMLSRHMDTGTITLKIDIGLQKTVVKDAGATMGTRPAINPKIGYKIGFVMQSKTEEKGDVIPKGSDELVVGDDGAFYLVSREEASGQLSMFSSYDEYLREAMA